MAAYYGDDREAFDEDERAAFVRAKGQSSVEMKRRDPEAVGGKFPSLRGPKHPKKSCCVYAHDGVYFFWFFMSLTNFIIWMLFLTGHFSKPVELTKETLTAVKVASEDGFSIARTVHSADRNTSGLETVASADAFVGGCVRLGSAGHARLSSASVMSNDSTLLFRWDLRLNPVFAVRGGGALTASDLSWVNQTSSVVQAAFPSNTAVLLPSAAVHRSGYARGATQLEPTQVVRSRMIMDTLYDVVCVGLTSVASSATTFHVSLQWEEIRLDL